MAQQLKAPKKALTIRQPWVWCITDLQSYPKRVETRTWAPPGDWRGPIALHAAATVDAKVMAAFERDWGEDAPRRDQLVTGAVVAVADLVEVHPAWGEGCGPGCADWGGMDPGTFHWHFDDVTVLPDPVPCKGRLQLWNLDEDVSTAVAAGLEATLR